MNEISFDFYRSNRTSRPHFIRNWNLMLSISYIKIKVHRTKKKQYKTQISLQFLFKTCLDICTYTTKYSGKKNICSVLHSPLMINSVKLDLYVQQINTKINEDREDLCSRNSYSRNIQFKSLPLHLECVFFKNTIFWEMPRRAYRLHLQGRRVSQASSQQKVGCKQATCLAYSSTLKLEAAYSS
jgi:hypothetical protein